MPSIELDTKRWVKVSPVEDETIKVTAKGFACYWSRSATPPEKASEGTELAESASVTVEEPCGRWFRSKEPSATETPLQPAILEVEQGPTGVGGEEITTGMIDKEAVTASKIASEAVSEAKIKAGAVSEGKLGAKAVGAEKTNQASVPTPSGTENEKVVGAGGVARTLMVAYTGNNAETKVKIKHSFEKQGVIAVAMKSASKLPTEQPTTALGKWVNESASEGTYTFTAAPAAKEEMFILIVG